VLGSCVAVCLWDKRRGVGGMNHFVLPIARLGKEALATAMWRSTSFSPACCDLVAEFPTFRRRCLVARRCCRLAADRLWDRTTLTSRWLVCGAMASGSPRAVRGGILGQQIRFNTRTGLVLVRYLSNAAAADAVTRRQTVDLVARDAWSG